MVWLSDAMMRHPADLPPRDIPHDLVAFAMLGGPWLVRLLFCLRLFRFVFHALAPWRCGAYLEIRRRLAMVGELRA